MSSKTHLGLEINDKEIRYVEMIQNAGSFSLGAHGEIKLPEGIVRDGSIQQGIKLLEMLTAMNKKGKWKDVSVAELPEQIYLADILLEAGFKKIYFESAGAALARVAIPEKSDETDMVVYFAGDRMDIYMTGRRSADLLSTSKFSSDLFIKSHDKEIIHSFIREKIDEQYISWHIHKDKEGKKRPKADKILLAGRLDDAEDLAGYLSKSLKIKTELAHVWQNIFSFEKVIPSMNFKDSLRYAAAIGLAVRPFEK